MELVDTHCHIQSAGVAGGERITSELWGKSELTGEAMVKNAKEAAVTKLICVGCDLDDSRLAAEFARHHPGCWSSVGIHPHEAVRYSGAKEKLAEFAALAARPKVVAVGECGLDYFYNHSPKSDQIKLLKFQIELALEKDLPLIFHVREAYEDFWPVFESFNEKRKIRGVLHSFTDSAGNLERVLGHGLFIGVNGIATFAKNPEQLEVYESVPLDNLLLETDAPFLTPTPYRGTINEPKHIREIARFLSELRHEPLETIARGTSANARQLFGI